MTMPLFHRLALAHFALASLAAPAFADEVFASANGNSVLVSTGGGTTSVVATTGAATNGAATTSVAATNGAATTSVAATTGAATTSVAATGAGAPDAEPELAAEPVEREPPAALAYAAPPPAPRAANTLGIDALAVVPVGDYADVANIGIGAGVRIEVPAGGGFITGRIGAVFHTSDYFDSRLTVVPAYAGYRKPLGPSGAYIAGELGITFAWATVDTSYGDMSTSDSELGALLSGGVRRGALDLRAGLFTPDLDDAFGLIATAGYDFAAF